MADVRKAHAGKSEIVNAIADKIKTSNGVVIAEYAGLTVADMTELRNMARERNIFIKVYKDSLVTRAIDSLKIEGLAPYLTKQNIYMFSDDAIAPAKLVAEFAKKHDQLVLKAGIYEGKVMDTAAITEIATLPSKDELYSMFASSLIYPLRQFMNVVKEIAKTRPE
jgi:large subunit ribosomal protein L10